AVLNILRCAAAEDLVCPAHDGVDVLRSSASKVVEAAAPLQLAVKEPEDSWVFANAEYPGYDWTLRARTPWTEFAEFADICRSRSQARCARTPRTSRTTLPSSSETSSTWTTTTPVSWTTGFGSRPRRPGDPHRADREAALRPYLERTTNPTQAAQRQQIPAPAVAGRLARSTPLPQLDGDACRGKMVFADGYIVDLQTGERRRALPSDRMKLRAAADSKAWEPQTPTLLFDYIADFLAHRQAGDGQLQGGAACAEVTFTRAVTADPRYCELLYMYGLGNAGKDVIGLLFMSFFGFSDIHYGVMAPGGFTHRRDGEAATPLMGRLPGKRYLWLSEVPEHKDLNGEFLKPFCEGENFGRPRLTSVLQPRRVRPWQTLTEFVSRPQLLTQKKCSQIRPKPPGVEELEREFCVGDSAFEEAPSVERFVELHCVKVTSHGEGSKYTEFIAKLAVFLGVSSRVAKLEARRAGYTSHRGAQRIVISSHGAWKLKPERSQG
ncbi:unnamed protein product, partial [Symbiodinium pilosum]